MVPESVLGQRRLLLEGFVASVAELTELAAHEIREFVKTRLARHEYPRAIEFVDSLPTTGKIMLRELREREGAKMRAAT
jgi:acyl-coenzyme A synthetase/AMP-(fatty) acid ligase